MSDDWQDYEQDDSDAAQFQQQLDERGRREDEAVERGERLRREFLANNAEWQRLNDLWWARIRKLMYGRS